MIYANINHCPKKLSAQSHHHQHSGSHENNHHHSGNHLGTVTEEHHKHDHHHNSTPSETSDHCKTLVTHENDYKSSIVVYADCHASSRGLFAGMILMILKIVFIILLHVAARNK